MNIRQVLASAAASALVATLLATPAMAASPKDRLYSVRLVKVSVAQLAEEVGRATGKIMIISPSVKSTVTLDTEAPMSADALFESFVRVLDEQGLRVTQDSNGYIRIATTYETFGLTWT
jgi:type II secretory pathway component GspD/PulD (secretin)